MKGEKMRLVDGPVHIVANPVIEIIEVLLGDDVIPVDVEDVVEEVDKLVSLEGGEEELAQGSHRLLLLGPGDERAPRVLLPGLGFLFLFYYLDNLFFMLTFRLNASFFVQFLIVVI